jgi:DNA-binding GntR family transcriptional regulator
MFMAAASNQKLGGMQSRLPKRHISATVYSVQRAQSFDRQNISEELADKIREMIIDGGIPAGSRINEVHLARDLGVSRTPLREAIARLVREGALATVPRVGAFVKPLTVDEFEEVYSIRTLLDPEALRLSGIPRQAQIDHLERLNKRIGAAKTAIEIIALDDEWHLLLVENCPNKVLLDLIRDFMRRTRRYELALMRERQQVDVATETHDQIIAALRRAKLDDAIAILKRNMESGREPIRSWLLEREIRR